MGTRLALNAGDGPTSVTVRSSWTDGAGCRGKRATESANLQQQRSRCWQVAMSAARAGMGISSSHLAGQAARVAAWRREVTSFAHLALGQACPGCHRSSSARHALNSTLVLAIRAVLERKVSAVYLL